MDCSIAYMVGIVAGILRLIPLLCTALTAGKLPAVGAVQRDCERVYRRRTEARLHGPDSDHKLPGHGREAACLQSGGPARSQTERPHTTTARLNRPHCKTTRPENQPDTAETDHTHPRPGAKARIRNVLRQYAREYADGMTRTLTDTINSS